MNTAHEFSQQIQNTVQSACLGVNTNALVWRPAVESLIGARDAEWMRSGEWVTQTAAQRELRRWFDIQAEALAEGAEMLVGEGHPEAAGLLRERAERLRYPKTVVAVPVRDAGMG